MIEELIAVVLPEVISVGNALLADLLPRAAPWLAELALKVFFPNGVPPLEERALALALELVDTSLHGLVARRLVDPHIMELLDHVAPKIKALQPPPDLLSKISRGSDEHLTSWVRRLSAATRDNPSPLSPADVLSDILNL